VEEPEITIDPSLYFTPLHPTICAFSFQFVPVTSSTMLTASNTVFAFDSTTGISTIYGIVHGINGIFKFNVLASALNKLYATIFATVKVITPVV
jgi:hypothetical protein